MGANFFKRKLELAAGKKRQKFSIPRNILNYPDENAKFVIVKRTHL